MGPVVVRVRPTVPAVPGMGQDAPWVLPVSIIMDITIHIITPAITIIMLHRPPIMHPIMHRTMPPTMPLITPPTMLLITPRIMHPITPPTMVAGAVQYPVLFIFELRIQKVYVNYIIWRCVVIYKGSTLYKLPKWI